MNDLGRFLERLLRRARELVDRILGRHKPKPNPPKPKEAPAKSPRNFQVEVDDMKNALFSWDLPTLRQQGGPLDPADIIGTEISVRIVPTDPELPELEWSVLGRADGTETTFTQNRMNAGTYDARARVVTRATDENGDPSEALGAEALLRFEVSDESPAAAVEGFSVELSDAA